MKRLGWNLVLGVATTAVFATAVLATGCGKSETTAPTTEAPAQPAQQAVAAAPAKEVPSDASPDQVISVFLDAMKAGDAATTEALLTIKAREETTRLGLPVAPSAAPNAVFEVAPAQVLPNNPNGAHVQARWTEKYNDETITNEVIWVLRKQNDGWRVAGFAIELVPGQGPQFLNFEDPQDMMNKHKEALAAAETLEAQKAVQAATAGAAQPAGEPAALQAAQPAGPSETQLK
jgi:hypothetical protein